MGENNCWEREIVITELTEGKESMLQLQKHFDPMKQDVCQCLAAEILSSYDKALSLLNDTTLSGMISKGKEIINPAPSSSTAKLESPHLLPDKSTKSCDRPSNSRKREYYRCARNRLSYCEATKTVQRSETEALAFEVTYGESHSNGQENKNQNEEQLLAVQTKETQCDKVVGRAAGEISESDIRDSVRASLFAGAAEACNNQLLVFYPSIAHVMCDAASRTSFISIW